MSPITQTCDSHCHHVSGAAKSHQHNSDNTAYRLVEKVITVALGTFAFLASPVLFASAFAIGTLIGIFSYTKPVHCNSQQTSESSCSHGFIERRLGIKLPDSLALLAGAAVVAEHIDHHPTTFVSIAAVTFGVWAGNLIAPALQDSYRKISIWASGQKEMLVPA